jgi:hypothetical protein
VQLTTSKISFEIRGFISMLLLNVGVFCKFSLNYSVVTLLFILPETVVSSWKSLWWRARQRFRVFTLRNVMFRAVLMMIPVSPLMTPCILVPVYQSTRLHIPKTDVLWLSFLQTRLPRLNQLNCLLLSDLIAYVVLRFRDRMQSQSTVQTAALLLCLDSSAGGSRGMLS